MARVILVEVKDPLRFLFCVGVTDGETKLRKTSSVTEEGMEEEKS